MLKRLAVASLLVLLLPLHAAALDTQDLLSLVAMPLAVAAVSDMTNVPQNQLFDLVSLLNQADVPPAQFVEVVRYVPVALVTPVDNGPTFVEYVRMQEQQGLRGTQLVTVIEDRYRTIGVPADLDVVAPRVVEVDRNTFVPETVRTRVNEITTTAVNTPRTNWSSHPHGGPPGQLKKIEGVQTGAEIVHRNRAPKHLKHEDRVVVVQPRTVVNPVVVPRGNDRGDQGMARGHEGNHGQGGGHGHGQGQGKGKGKGKG
jgi:hypothetical protein